MWNELAPLAYQDESLMLQPTKLLGQAIVLVLPELRTHSIDPTVG